MRAANASSHRHLTAGKGKLALLALAGLVVAVFATAVITSSTATPAQAQGAATILPNISTDLGYAGPDVVISGTASSPTAITDVAITVQDASSLLYVQDNGTTFGTPPTELDASLALLPPPGDFTVNWRVPLELPNGNYTVVIMATEADGLVTDLGPIAFTVADQIETPDVQLIAQSADWQYFDQGIEPPTVVTNDWYDIAYDESTWLTGPAPLGWSSNETTTIASDDPQGDPLITAYFRHTFTIADLTEFATYEFTMFRDDGAVVWVNGQEWARDNMKSVGPVRYDNLALSASSDVVAGEIESSLFVVGENTISVEVHQVQPTSSDLGFWVELVGTSAAQPLLESEAREGAYVLAAGDIARCENDGDELVAEQIGDLFDTDAGIFLALGDLAYGEGTVQQFQSCYDPTLGQFKDVTWPSPGNHDHLTFPNAAGYRWYFGEAAGPLAGPAGGLWYSFDIDEHWHAIALDSDCEGPDPLPGSINGDGCAVGSEQEQWLRADLAANADKNIIAYFHHPPYTNNQKNDHENTWPLWKALNEYGADLTLHGHEHHYERYGTMNGWGVRDELYGAREFIVGTGGREPRYWLDFQDSRSDFRGIFPDNTFDYGVLQLWLRPDGYDWKWESIFGLAPVDEGTSPLSQPFPKGLLSGLVTADDGSGGVADVDVCAVFLRDNTRTCTQTTAAGTYVFDPMFIGDYRVTFDDPDEDHTPQISTVSLPESGVGESVVLERLRSIGGQLTIDETGAPLADAQACATNIIGGAAKCATTSANGSWQIDGLQAGTYSVAFEAIGRRAECLFDDEGCQSPTQIVVVNTANVIGLNAGMQAQDGDINCDGRLNILDAYAMSLFVVELRTDGGPCPLDDPLSQIYAGTADATLDGNLNISDAYALAQCAISLPREFCP